MAGIDQPTLWGTEKEYGLELPAQGLQGFPETPEEAAEIWAPVEKRMTERIMAEPEKKTRPADREAFRASALKQLPGQKDPFLRSPHQEARILFDQRIEGLRQHVLKGIPRGTRLTAEQEQHFSDQAFQLFKMCFAEAAGSIENAKDALSNMMSRFDKMQEEQIARATQAARETPAEREAREKRLIAYREKVKKPTTKAGAAAIQVYDRFRAENPDYKGDIKDFQKALRAKDPLEMVLGLAGKDFRVQVGTMSLGEVAQQYLDAITKLKGGPSEAKMPDAKLHKGKIIRDTVTGKRYKSNGTKWVEIKK